MAETKGSEELFKSLQSHSDRSSPTGIDVAPLIDVVFILLIFFLVTTTFVRDTGVDVNRPGAVVSRSLEPTSLRVSITASNEIFTDGGRVNLEELRIKIAEFVARDRQRSVIVIPDRDVPSGRLIEVMDVARLAGALDVAVATERRGDSW